VDLEVASKKVCDGIGVQVRKDGHPSEERTQVSIADREDAHDVWLTIMSIVGKQLFIDVEAEQVTMHTVVIDHQLGSEYKATRVPTFGLFFPIHEYLENAAPEIGQELFKHTKARPVLRFVGHCMFIVLATCV
jgi:hypothetical protein